MTLEVLTLAISVLLAGSNHAAVAAQEQNNETGITPEEEFGLTMRLVESVPLVCMSENMTDIMKEACIVQGHYKGADNDDEDDDENEDTDE